MRRRLVTGVALAAAGIALALASCSGPEWTDGPRVERLSGREGGAVTFTSTTPYDFADARAGGQPTATVAGQVTFPPEGQTIRGAAILSHGSGGPGGRQTRMAERLAGQGIVAFALDHFGPRDVDSTVRDQLRLTAQAMLADIAAARDLLATHPEIEAGRIGVIGWSKGGIAASLGAVERLAGYVGLADPPLAFAVAFYPFCGFDLDEEPLSAPLLYLVGEEDDWTPPDPCARQARAWAEAGQPVEIEVFEGALHGFDSRTFTSFEIGRAITVHDTSPACTLTVDGEGNSVTLDGSGGVTTVAERRAFLDRCGRRGVTFGGDSQARAAAKARLDSFLDRVLGPSG